MLRNQSEETVNVRYNGCDVTVEAGALLDVIDFGIINTQIHAVEHHIMKVYPNKFVSVPRPTQGLTANEADKKIIELSQSLDILNKNHDKLIDNNNALSAEITEKNNTIDSLSKDIADLKKEVNSLKAKLKSATK